MDHFHVVEFIDGCLNDYDSGAIEDLESARAELAEFANEDRNYHGDVFRTWTPAGVDRYEQVDGPYILKIEACSEAECLEENA